MLGTSSTADSNQRQHDERRRRLREIVERLLSHYEDERRQRVAEAIRLQVAQVSPANLADFISELAEEERLVAAKQKPASWLIEALKEPKRGRA